MELADYRKSEAFSNPYVIKCTLLGHHGVGKVVNISVSLEILTVKR